MRSVQIAPAEGEPPRPHKEIQSRATAWAEIRGGQRAVDPIPREVSFSNSGGCDLGQNPAARSRGSMLRTEEYRKLYCSRGGRARNIQPCRILRRRAKTQDPLPSLCGATANRECRYRPEEHLT